MPGAHDACSLLHVQPDVAFGGALRLAGMQPDAYTEHHPLRPGMVGEGTLHGDGSRDRIRRAGKGDEEGIPLGIDLVAVPAFEGGAQQVAIVGQHVAVPLLQPLEEGGGPFEIAEEQCKGSGWHVRHSRSPQYAYRSVCSCARFLSSGSPSSAERYRWYFLTLLCDNNHKLARELSLFRTRIHVFTQAYLRLKANVTHKLALGQI
jgi:hypothetical protein